MLALGIWLAAAQAQEERAPAQAEIDALNHLTVAVASMMEGASAESVRSAVIENVRHDPRWAEAKKAVDRVVAVCSDGATIQAQIAALTQRAESEAEQERQQAFSRNLRTLIAIGGAASSGGSTLSLLKLAPTLLGDGQGAASGTGAALAGKEQEWHRALAEVGLELERMKEQVRLQGGLPDGDIVTLQDAQLFVSTLRDLDAGHVDKARRELLLLARARSRFPELQYHLGLLYSGDSPQRALGYFRRAVDQTGGILKEDRAGGESALRLGMAALTEGIWAESLEAREAKLKEAGDWGRRCLKHLPRSSDGHVLVALAEAERVREYSELLEVCQEVLEIDPDHAWARANVIDALSRTNRLAGAMPHLDELLRRAPEWAPSLLASEFVGESKTPKELSQVLTPRIELRVERRADRWVPVARNVGRIPLVGAWAVASVTYPAGSRRTSAASAPWPRLDPGAEVAFAELGGPSGAEPLRLELRLYAANGFAAAAIGEARASAPFEAVATEQFQAWEPVQATAGAVSVWFQVVRDATGTALLVCGREALLHKVQVGIHFGEAEGQEHRGALIRAWTASPTLRIPLPATFADELARKPSCACYVKATEGTAVARMTIETGVRALRLTLKRLSLAPADFAGNDDGANAAPELFVTVRLNDETALSTQSDFAHDTFDVEWPRARPERHGRPHRGPGRPRAAPEEPGFEASFTSSDRLRIRLWDKDIASHDLLLEWNLGWNEIKGIGDTLTLRSRNGSVVVFKAERLR